MLNFLNRYYYADIDKIREKTRELINRDEWNSDFSKKELLKFIKINYDDKK